MAAKIKDGLFVGDAETSRDVEFLELNKISNLINLAGRDDLMYPSQKHVAQTND
jgi:hypothetical protein